MYSVPDRSNHHPEDDLPAWVFDYDQCDHCEGAIDEGRDYADYDISVCDCAECDLCEGLASKSADEYVIIKVSKTKNRLPSIADKIICNTCALKIGEFL